VRICTGCGLHPTRPGTRRIPLPLYCRSCRAAEDQLAIDIEFFGSRTVTGERCRGPGQQNSARAERIVVGKALQSRAERLLATLSGIERWVWSLVVKGLSERRIAERLGISRQEVFSWYLQPLRVAAGIPARPRRYSGRRA
jgi:hypothetical protein